MSDNILNKSNVAQAFDVETKLSVINTTILIYSQLLYNHGVPMHQITALQDAVLETAVKVVTGQKHLVTVANDTVH